MPSLTVNVSFSEEEREVLSAATSKKLVKDVLADLAERFTGTGAATSLTRARKTPTGADLEAAITDLEQRAASLETLPQSELRDDALRKMREALELMNSAQQQVRQHLGGSGQ